MEGHEFADVCYGCEFKGVAVATMSVADTLGIFLIAVLGVVEKEIGVEREFMA